MDALIRRGGEPVDGLEANMDMFALVPQKLPGLQDREADVEAMDFTPNLATLVRVAQQQSGGRLGDLDQKSEEGRRGFMGAQEEIWALEKERGRGRGREVNRSNKPRFPPSPPRITRPPPSSPLRRMIRAPVAAIKWLHEHTGMGGIFSSKETEDEAEDLEEDKEVKRRKKRKDLPEPAGSRRPKKGMRAMAIRRAKGGRGEERGIEKNFFANSSKASKESKWNTVTRILSSRPGGWNARLEIEDMKDLADAMQTAGYKSGVGYLVEAKMRHLENGGAWEPRHERVFKLCKTALDRTKGPKKKALEVPYTERQPPPLKGLRWKTGVKFAYELFIFATIWMMREIELALMTVKDILFDHINKKVTVTWRNSKQDKTGEGVRRSLQCTCSKKKCSNECPYAVSYDLVTKVEGANGTETELVIARNRQEPTKANLVSSWRLLFKKRVGGHSARRSGALHYIRSGWQVQQVAFLGRWSSNVILDYAKEALESTPANIKLFNQTHRAVRQNLVGDSENVQNMMVTHDRLKTDVEVLKVKLEGSSKEVQDLANQFEEFQSKGGGNLPPFVQSMSSKMIHFNISLVATSPPMTWRTKCGWHYSGSQYIFLNKAEPHLPQCAKCKAAQVQGG